MSLDVFKAVVQGYSDHIFDLQVVAVHQGYWSGYYNRTKKPKGLDKIIRKMFQTKSKKDSQPDKRTRAEDVDVETFLAREQKRLSQIK